MPRKSITTRTGDHGETRLLDNTRVRKYHVRPEAYGTLDEAGAFLGRARSVTSIPYICTTLRTLQNHLYLLNSELACPEDKRDQLKTIITNQQLGYLDTCITFIEDNIEMPMKFYLPGQSPVSADIDIARTIVRRAERRIVELDGEEPLENNYILPYLNRLSDLLFLLARYEEFKNGIDYAHPEAE
ncbi:MAG: cob(I)yrinic acid a,c-diamide adenosyltransferase [candidate division KSB1 bacterium]|nr:cob(I)yrinic acid a,c-diamide adenosyltransferase [candidate division KSB1 bacterium]